MPGLMNGIVIEGFRFLEHVYNIGIYWDSGAGNAANNSGICYAVGVGRLREGQL